MLRISTNGPGEIRRRTMRLGVAVSVVILALLTATCGSSGESAPAAAPTTAPVATNVPEPTATPQPTAVPTPEFVPGPREVSFVDGQFDLVFLYRNEPDLAAVIDVVDVESILEPELKRIGPLIEDEHTKFVFKTITKDLNATNLAKLERDGYVVVFDIQPGRIDFRLNPNASTSIADFWEVIAPMELASESLSKIRFADANGTYGDSLLDLMVSRGMQLAFQQQLFPDQEERLRAHQPEYAAVIYDLSPEGETELWAAATPDLGVLSVPVVSRFFDLYTGGTGEFPTGAGDAIGWRIVQAYLDNNPGVLASSLLRIPTEDIVEGADYNP